MATTWDHAGMIMDHMQATGATPQEIDDWDEYDLDITQAQHEPYCTGDQCDTTS